VTLDVMRRKFVLLSAVPLAVLLTAAGASAVDEPSLQGGAPRVIPVAEPHRGLPLGQARPRAPADGAFVVEHVRRGARVALHAAPNGRVVVRVGSRTVFGSPQTLTVAARAPGWLGVTSEAVAGGAIAWVREDDPALKPMRTHTVLRVSLARRELDLVVRHRVRYRIMVGVGSPGSPTPAGRYAVTDKLSGSRFGSGYGCCILALSGYQKHMPGTWQGGNRLAIHGTDDPRSIGRMWSLGCLHADTAALVLLMRKVPLGTPVVVKD
jgi:hypothetical protein